MSGARLTPLARGVARLLFPGAALDWLVPVFARTLPGAALVLCGSLVAAGLGLVLPMLTKAVIDRGIIARDMEALVVWAGASFALGLVSVALGLASSLLHLRASAAMLSGLRLRVLEAALGRHPHLPDLAVGELATRVDGDAAEIQRFLFDSVMVAVVAVFRLVGGAALMIALDWRLAALPILAAPLELAFLSHARRTTRLRAAAVRDSRGALTAHLTESLALLAPLRDLGAIPQRLAGFGALQAIQVRDLTRQRLWSELVSGAGQIVAAVVRGAVLLVGGWFVIRGDWPIGSLVAFLAYGGMMSGPLRNLLGLYHAQAAAGVALDRLAAVMASEADRRAGLDCPGTPATLTLTGARAVAGRHVPASLTIRRGECVLIDGASGIGKSRLVAALAGRAPLAEGSITIDGLAVDRASLASVSRAILLLPQRPAILRGTLAENLRLGAPEAPEAALWRALAQADLAPWAHEAGGLDAALTETGGNLSGGLRQRIALARAFVRPAGVMVFDESFSEIDAPAAARILTAIRRDFADRTRIFIAHSGPVRAQAFDQAIALTSDEQASLNSRGGTPYQREKAREKAVWSE